MCRGLERLSEVEEQEGTPWSTEGGMSCGDICVIGSCQNSGRKMQKRNIVGRYNHHGFTGGVKMNSVGHTGTGTGTSITSTVMEMRHSSKKNSA